MPAESQLLPHLCVCVKALLLYVRDLKFGPFERITTETGQLGQRLPFSHFCPIEVGGCDSIAATSMDVFAVDGPDSYPLL